MTKLLGKNASLRFAARNRLAGHASSPRWTVFRSKNDIYISNQSASGLLKVSLHQSGIFRYALTSQLASHDPHGSSNNRCSSRWTEPCLNDIKHAEILSIQTFSFIEWPTIRLPDEKRTHFLANPPIGFAQEVSFFMSMSNPLHWTDKIWKVDNILGVYQLSEEKFLAVRQRVKPLTSDISLNIENAILKAPQKFVIGEKEPVQFPLSAYWVTISEHTKHHCTIYNAFGVSPALPSPRVGWSTKSGTRFKDSL